MEELRSLLLEKAKTVQGSFYLDQKGDLCAGQVGSALITEAGNIYTGISVDLACGIGCCAEHGAIFEMLKHRESKIKMIVAYGKRGILPPCGRCRELIAQINPANFDTDVIVSANQIMKLKDLLPNYWKVISPQKIK